VPRTGRTVDLAIGERDQGLILRRRDGSRLDRRTGHRRVRSIGRRAGLGLVHPHMLRAGFIMGALDAGGSRSVGDAQEEEVEESKRYHASCWGRPFET